MKVNWNYCQENSDDLLAQGLRYLIMSEELHWFDIKSSHTGNYIIYLSNKPYYIGEAKNIKNRIKQQFSKESSFYKNYIEYCNKHCISAFLNIDMFKVKFIETNIGRKEIEEFGIVNLPTILNKFQIEKRKSTDCKINEEIWQVVQSRKNELLSEGEKNLFDQKAISWNVAIMPCAPGLYYVINPYGVLIYIGESSDIKGRHKTHSTKTYFSALRRHIATDVLGISFIAKKKLSDSDDGKVDEYLNRCKIGYIQVNFGRYELEHLVIQKRKPLLNRKDNNYE